MPAMQNPQRASGGGRGSAAVPRMVSAPRASAPARVFPRTQKPRVKPKMSASQRRITTTQALKEDNAKYLARKGRRDARGSTVLSKVKVETVGERNKPQISTVDRVKQRDPDAAKRKTRDERMRVPPGGRKLDPKHNLKGKSFEELNAYWNRRLSARQRKQAEDRALGKVRKRIAEERQLEVERQAFREDARFAAGRLSGDNTTARNAARRVGMKLNPIEPTDAQKAIAKQRAMDLREYRRAQRIATENAQARKAAYEKPPGYKTPTESPKVGEKGNTKKGKLQRSGEDILPKPPRRTMREAEKKAKYSDPTGDAAVARVMKSVERRETARLQRERKSGSRRVGRRDR